MSEFVRLEYDFHYSMSIIGHKIKIWVKDGKLYYSKFVTPDDFSGSLKKSAAEDFDELFIEDRVSEMSVEEFAAKLEKVNIAKWKKRYEDPCVCDGWQWYVEYKTSDGTVKSEGSNAKPGNWSTFRKVMAEVAGVF